MIHRLMESSSTLERENRLRWPVEASRVEEWGQHTHVRIPLELASDAGGRLPVNPFTRFRYAVVGREWHQHLSMDRYQPGIN
jgi:hypothetical protein